ncbi:MAG: alpha/beta hydrolase [Cellvibrionaceae bacterium]
MIFSRPLFSFTCTNTFINICTAACANAISIFLFFFFSSLAFSQNTPLYNASPESDVDFLLKNNTVNDNKDENEEGSKNIPQPFDLSTLPVRWKTERVQEPLWQSEMFVVQAGLENRQTVVLVHGLGQAGFTDWLSVIPALESEYHVIAIDLPGFGRSSKPEGKYSPGNYSQVLSWVIDRYAHNPVVLVGHSMGGAISLQHAANYPQQVERLVLVDAAGILERTALLKINGELPIDLEKVPKPFRRFGAQLLNVGRSIIEWTGVTPDPTGILSESNLAWNALFNDRENGNAALALIMHNFSGAIQSLNKQTYLIWGGDDRIAPLRTGYLLAGRLKNSQLSIINGAAHVPMKSHSVIFNHHLLQAIQQDKVIHNDELFTAEQLNEGQFEKTEVLKVKKGVLRCNEQHGVVYSGHFEEVVISECTGVTLKNLTTQRLRINNSLVDLYNVAVENHDGEAVVGVQSVVTATNARFVGSPSVLSIGSRWDLAGVTIVSREKSTNESTMEFYKGAIEVKTKSRFVFSVSDLLKPSGAVNLHRVVTGENIILDDVF